MAIPSKARREHQSVSLDEAPAKVTVRELLDGKGRQRRTQVFVQTADKAAAAEAAGIDVINLAYTHASGEVASAAPKTFNMFGLHWKNYASDTELLRGAFDAMFDGADSIYCAKPPESIEALAREGVPVCPHVGLVPTKRTWTGGWRSVGTTCDQAWRLYQEVKRYEAAGAFAVEMEVVPEQVAVEIARRTSMLVISMGSGSGGDVQYLFASDILGQSPHRVPRHAKVYRNFKLEFERLQRERVEAFKEFVADVQTGSYPGPKHTVSADSLELEKFLDKLR